MKVEDLPAKYLAMINEAAGKPHSSTGAVATCLAEILTLHDKKKQGDMPIFPLKGQDLLTIDTVKFYRGLCIINGLLEQANEVERALDELYDFSERNPGQMKLPDHKHVGVGE